MVLKPVVALDLDGTLLDYHRHFIRFANQFFGIEVPEDSYDARMDFHRYFGVSKVSYRECKLAYRRGQLKRSLPLLPPPLPQANELVRTLRRRGVGVWLCTTRPYLSHDEVDAATRHNLRRNGIAYDGIIWGEHKYRELVRTVGANRVVAVLDDLPDMCRQAEGLGLPVAFALRPHNLHQYAALGCPWPALGGHDETMMWMLENLDRWREKNKWTPRKQPSKTS